MPDWLASAIRAAYRELVGDDADAPVAVRSSATAEDTESASFAGMNETFLNVRGADARARRGAPLLGVAVRRAHRSTTAPSAASTRPTWTSPSSCSARSPRPAPGVMFTVDPASGATDRLVIEGSFGLGEAVVSRQRLAGPLRRREGDAGDLERARCATRSS